MQELTTYSELTEGHATAILPGPLDGESIPSQHQQPLPDSEEEDTKASDEVRRGREQFLKIYQEKKTEDGDNAGQDEEIKEIKFKKETLGDEDMESRGKLIRLKTGQDGDRKPLIQEVKTIEAPGVALPEVKKPAESQQQAEEEAPIKIFKPFNWEEAERVEAKH